MNIMQKSVDNATLSLPRWMIKHKNGIKTLGWALLNAVILYYCLEVGNKNFLFNGVLYTFVNILTIFVLQSAVYLIVQRWWLASAITTLPVAILSVANYYTLLFRNQPISTQDIHNAGTALSVINSYNFTLNIYVSIILTLLVLNILVIIKLFRVERGRKRTWKKELIKNGALLLCGALFLHGVYFAENSLKPKNTFVWSWEDTYYKYGYIASSIEVLQNSLNVVNKPDGYSEESLKSLLDKPVATGITHTPDVILILNETFYDLRDLVELETDEETMPFIDGLKNAVKGRCVVAGTGGGTNKSEYELLTSNSLQIMPGITPFNYLNFNNANSAVSHLEKLGYTTWSAHCAPGLNYSRSNVYPKLGFDTVKFDTDFKLKDFYEQRYYATDESCYRELISDYESMGNDPRFMYLLTIQNHGGWELNEDSADTVHSLTDFGDYTDDVNEFLTGIRMSDEAFKKLTEYFETVDRPVVVCMVGDHAPSFAQELNTNRSEETVFKLRSTPYVMWANFDLNQTGTENTSMPMIMPKLFEISGVPLSPFYSYMLDLSRNVPIVTANNVFKTNDGQIHYYNNTDAPYKNEINTYFNLVYNNVGTDTERIDRIFEPQTK